MTDQPRIPLAQPDASDPRVRADVARSSVGLFPLEPGAAKTLLEALLDDESAVVRTAVADALAEIGARDAGIALDWAEEWAGADPDDRRVQLLRHGLRHLRAAGIARAFRVTDRLDYQR